ncbi:MAG: hypothetical protein QG635_768 [Bacteroidota bacterium]|nr:hypothetical protein [Bacteroidota bacterium]
MKIIYLFVFIFCGTLYCQSLSVFEADTSGFPTIKAKFFAIDAAGNQITNLSVSDFQVTENGQQRTVTNVSCPAPDTTQALSSILTIDVSGSMRGSNIILAQEAANAWIDALPLGKSECAITSFDQTNYLNLDYSTDRNCLIKAINSLQAIGGTDYDAALLNQPAGSLLITQKGKFKKVIVFLSDGAPNKEPQTTKIISEAINQKVTIYSVIIGMKCPQSMKKISEQTGGMWFEYVNSTEQAKRIYLQILQTAQGGEPCSIEWQSGVFCIAETTLANIKLLQNNTKSEISYKYPIKSVAKLEFTPSMISFIKAQPGGKFEKTITVTARNYDFEISNIFSSNAAFDINPKKFILKAGKSIDLTVSFFPIDSGYINSVFEIVNNLCPVKYYASGGFPGKKSKERILKLIRPNGGETFVVGSDTVVTWDGILPNEKVTIEYSTNNGENWIKICDTAKGLSYNWRVPKTPSGKCLARITSKTTNVFVDIEMILIPAGIFKMGNTGAYSGSTDEKPVNDVSLTKDYLMSVYEITQFQYKEIMGKNPSNFKEDNLPVEMVAWYDAIEFCNKLSEKEGLMPCYSGSEPNIVCDWNANGYRLPTEAEWEYACKAGTDNDFYNGNMTNSGCSPIDTTLNKIGWYCGNSDIKTYEVGQKEPNAFGLYDMTGNVSEWCWDWYSRNYYSSIIDINPTGPSKGSERVIRGGSWGSSAMYCRSAARGSYFTKNHSQIIGFRIVRSN